MTINRLYLKTPLGSMIACSTERGICLLEFDNRKNFDKQIELLKKQLNVESVIEQSNAHLDLLRKELAEYFEGKLNSFTVAIDMVGTDFQKQVWHSLLLIPYGKTISYAQQADLLGKPQSVRAVANANGKNKIAIVVPCHRVIGTNGTLTGYAGGIDKKRWLLDLEKNEDMLL